MVNTVINIFITLNNLQQMHLKLHQQKKSKNRISNWFLIGNKIANNITKMQRTSPQNNSETVTNKRYISLEESQRTIDNLTLVQ